MEASIIKQREYFKTGETFDLTFRINMLIKLRSILKKNENRLLAALKLDLGKPKFEGYTCEFILLYNEIDFAIKNIRNWAKPKHVKTPLFHFKSKSMIYSQPLGVCLIISPSNYPVQLTVSPLIGAIAAGNCISLKLSEYSENTSEVLADIINRTFDSRHIKVFLGDEKVSKELLLYKFDHIFFTGSTHIGKQVMRAAADNLTPITLELGGKCPCIIDKTADIDKSAQRIIWGKLLNAGQTCVAPDYVLVDATIKGVFVQAVIKYIKQFYGDNMLINEEYGFIVNDKNYNRLKALLNEGNIIFGGRYDDNKRKIEPTLIDSVSFQSNIMQDEIFGPILPIIEYDFIDNVIDTMSSLESPLALYLFSKDKAVKKQIIQKMRFGGGCINDTIIHLSNHNMGFGGVGNSGIGSYHGKASFETFSHKKSMLTKSFMFDIQFRYPPYKNKFNILKKFLK